MNNKICEAISNKQLIQFYYEGGIRVVEPHCYGIHKDTGKEVLCGFQTEGYSRSGGLPNWRFFIVDKISKLVVKNDHFTKPRPLYNPNGDKRMSTIFCNI